MMFKMQSLSVAVIAALGFSGVAAAATAPTPHYDLTETLCTAVAYTVDSPTDGDEDNFYQCVSDAKASGLTTKADLTAKICGNVAAYNEDYETIDNFQEPNPEQLKAALTAKLTTACEKAAADYNG